MPSSLRYNRPSTKYPQFRQHAVSHNHSLSPSSRHSMTVRYPDHERANSQESTGSSGQDDDFSMLKTELYPEKLKTRQIPRSSLAPTRLCSRPSGIPIFMALRTRVSLSDGARSSGSEYPASLYSHGPTSQTDIKDLSATSIGT